MRLLPALLATFLLSGSLLATPSTGSAQEAAGMASSSSSGGFGSALNQFRANYGLGGLREDRALSSAAQAFAEDMARGGYFSHTGRDGSNVVVRARAAGCRGQGYFAENIAWGQRSAQDAFNGWAASSGHRANMLGRNYGAYGLGQASGYWVLMFADGC
jgi:uncharacterized protein YkwD